MRLIPLILLGLLASCKTTTVSSDTLRLSMDVVGDEIENYIKRDRLIPQERKDDILGSIDVVQAALRAEEIDIVAFANPLMTIAAAHKAYVRNDSTLTEASKQRRLRSSTLIVRLVEQAQQGREP